MMSCTILLLFSFSLLRCYRCHFLLGCIIATVLFNSTRPNVDLFLTCPSSTFQMFATWRPRSVVDDCYDVGVRKWLLLARFVPSAVLRLIVLCIWLGWTSPVSTSWWSFVVFSFTSQVENDAVRSHTWGDLLANIFHKNISRTESFPRVDVYEKTRHFQHSATIVVTSYPTTQWVIRWTDEEHNNLALLAIYVFAIRE